MPVVFDEKSYDKVLIRALFEFIVRTIFTLFDDKTFYVAFSARALAVAQGWHKSRRNVTRLLKVLS